ncbi:MAG: entericidin EcnAB [Comamonas sp.]|nr:entericidin EcnAB [Comamonas sp.]
MRKHILALITLALAFTLGACSNTWTGVKEDSKKAGHATGKGLEKAGEKLQQITE